MDRIALIGYRGSGKSTAAPLVAAKLGWHVFDADAALEQETGQSITTLFAQLGEGAFRDHESAQLSQALDQEKIVLACGGGVVLREINRERLNGLAFTVWLDASAETCWQRIQNDPTPRPPLTDLGGLAEVRQLMQARRTLYQATARAVVVAEASPEDVAAAILQAWHSRRTPE